MHIESQIGAGGSLEQVRGFANKAPEHAASIAGIISSIEHGKIGGGEIGHEVIASAIEIVQFHLSEATRLFEAGRANKTLVEAGKLLAWIHNAWDGGPLISLPDIYQYGPNFVRNKADAQKLVGILVDHGWLRDVGPNEVKGVRRQETFWIVEVGP